MTEQTEQVETNTVEGPSLPERALDLFLAYRKAWNTRIWAEQRARTADVSERAYLASHRSKAEDETLKYGRELEEALRTLSGGGETLPERVERDAAVAVLKQLAPVPDPLPDDYKAAYAIHKRLCELWGEAERASRRTGDHVVRLIKRDRAALERVEGETPDAA